VDAVDIKTDFDAIQTVVTNFLSNALNHVEGDRLIRISAKPADAGKIRIEIFNSGKPIPSESIERIWESFYKIDKARTRAYGGQGLGLSIVRTILTNLGCPFGVENRADGVAFHFDLPIVDD
ncbi:MAG: ATP-binding protein, partial [bacterium]